MKLKSSDSGIPFEDLIIEMFRNRNDFIYLNSVDEYLYKYAGDYCLVHLSTLKAALRGYFQILSNEGKHI